MIDNWPELLIGGVIGVVLTICLDVAKRAYSYARHLSAPSHNKYVGEHYTYNRSTTGDGSISQGALTIRYSKWRNKLIASEVQHAIGSEEGVYQYEGFMTEQEGLVRTIFMRDPASGERVTYVLLDRLHAPVDATSGVLASWDTDGRPVACSAVLSRTKLSEDTLESLLDKSVIRPRILPSSIARADAPAAPPLTEA